MFGVAIWQASSTEEKASQDEKPEAGGPAAPWRASTRCGFGAIVIASAVTVEEKRSGRIGNRCRKVDILVLGAFCRRERSRNDWRGVFGGHGKREVYVMGLARHFGRDTKSKPCL
jgi:hypothetical protein